MLVVADLLVGKYPRCHDSHEKQKNHNVEGHPIHNVTVFACKLMDSRGIFWTDSAKTFYVRTLNGPPNRQKST
jgi:hypothetical protein